MLVEVRVERDEAAERCVYDLVRRWLTYEGLTKHFVGEYEVVESQEGRGVQARSEIG